MIVFIRSRVTSGKRAGIGSSSVAMMLKDQAPDMSGAFM